MLNNVCKLWLRRISPFSGDKITHSTKHFLMGEKLNNPSFNQGLNVWK